MTDRDMAIALAQHRADLDEIAGTSAGTRFFARLFRAANCLESVHTKSAEIYRLSGVQAFALDIWKDLHVSNRQASMMIFDMLMTPPEPETESDEEEIDYGV